MNENTTRPASDVEAFLSNLVDRLSASITWVLAHEDDAFEAENALTAAWQATSAVRARVVESATDEAALDALAPTLDSLGRVMINLAQPAPIAPTSVRAACVLSNALTYARVARDAYLAFSAESAA